MNAEPDFYCSMPHHLREANLSVDLWKEMSGQLEQSCQIYDRQYDEISQVFLLNTFEI